MFPSHDPRRNIGELNYEYNGSLGISLHRNFSKCRKHPELLNTERMHTNSPYTDHSPPVPVAAPREADADGDTAYAGTKYPYFLSANKQGYSQTIATCGSAASICHASPTSSSLIDDNLGSMPLPGQLGTQDLMDMLQEVNQYKQRRNQDKTIPDNQSAHPHLTQDIAGSETTYQKHLGRSAPSIPDSMTSNAAQGPSSAPETPNTNTYLARPSSTRLQSPSAAIHQPALKPASSKPDVVYRQPQPFIGKLASSETQHAPLYTAQFSTSRARKRTATTNRPDIRALPNHDQDPIE